MKVRDAMHEAVEWRAPTTSIADIANLMKAEDIGAVPIGENDRLVGMVTDRDLALKVADNGADLSKVTAGDVMTKGIIYCEDDDDIDEALELMQSRQVRRLPVINDKKRMVGMLSIGDISAAASESQCGMLMRHVSAHH